MTNKDQGPSPHPREKITRKALIVWVSAVLVYIAAIASRTSFGVAGIDAIERFHVDATRIAVFTSVQVGVYALSQIPMGLLIDKFGPRKLLAIGALVMGLGQIILGLTDIYSVAIGARVLIGAGDATVFLSVMRLLPFWFPLRKTPIFTQLTTALGQLGQVISAVPFMALLGTSGWTVSFVSLGSVVAIVALAALFAVRDTPGASVKKNPAVQPADTSSTPVKPGLMTSLKLVLRNPVCWQGFFIHYLLMLWQNVFTLMWGVPLMTLAMGLSTTTVGLVLSLNTVFMIFAGPIIGLISARTGHRRDVVAIAMSVVPTTAWVIFLSSDTPPGVLAIILVNLAMGLTSPASSLGFDTIRERLDRKILAAATGLANMGGFLSAMVAAQVMGVMLDFSADGGSYEWNDFRFAYTAVLVIWAFGVAGFFIARLKGGPGRRMIAQLRHP